MDIMNKRNTCDGITFMNNLESESVSVAFFGPQYRGILDKLNYGNEGVRQTERIELQQMSEETIKDFIREIDRLLRPSGHMFLWVDKYHLCEGVTQWLEGTQLSLVDMIVWDKARIGMGYRSRRKSEYVMILQKSPTKARGIWTDHGIPDVWTEKVVRTHAHSKPIDLQKRLIEATTKEGDIVLDPAAGGYSVLEACKLSGRDFVGCDIA